MSKIRIAVIALDCLLIVLTLVFIFGNSVQNVESSTNISRDVTGVVEKIPPVKEAIEKGVIEKDSLEGTLRSLAHVAEFAVLGAEIMLLFLLLGIGSFKFTVLAPIILCLLIGFTDEGIQLLNDRSSQISDVIKDFAGSLCGILFILLIYGIIKLTKAKKQSES